VVKQRVCASEVLFVGRMWRKGQLLLLVLVMLKLKLKPTKQKTSECLHVL